MHIRILPAPTDTDIRSLHQFEPGEVISVPDELMQEAADALLANGHAEIVEE